MNWSYVKDMFIKFLNLPNINILFIGTFSPVQMLYNIIQ